MRKLLFAVMLCTLLFSCTKEQPTAKIYPKVQVRIITNFTDGSQVISLTAH